MGCYDMLLLSPATRRTFVSSKSIDTAFIVGSSGGEQARVSNCDRDNAVKISVLIKCVLGTTFGCV